MKCDNAAMDHKFVVCGTEPKYRLLQFCEYKMYIKDYFNVIQLLSPFSLQVIMELTSANVVTSKAYTPSLFATVLRKGCNGKVGSVAKEDICGICGGHGKKCLGCDGVINSGKLFCSLLIN